MISVLPAPVDFSFLSCSRPMTISEIDSHPKRIPQESHYRIPEKMSASNYHLWSQPADNAKTEQELLKSLITRQSDSESGPVYMLYGGTDERN